MINYKVIMVNLIVCFKIFIFILLGFILFLNIYKCLTLYIVYIFSFCIEDVNYSFILFEFVFIVCSWIVYSFFVF